MEHRLADPYPCAALGCAVIAESVTACKVRRCPHAWARISREDRQRQAAHDAKEKESGRERGDDEHGGGGDRLARLPLMTAQFSAPPALPKLTIWRGGANS